jgi:Na+/proline symporter
VVNDFYKRFISRNAEEKKLVLVSRITTVLMMALSLVTTMMMNTISGAWAFIIEAGAGLGLVLILRWFWWRVNAWSEIAAMITPMIVYGIIKYGTTIQFPQTLFYIVSATTIVWIIVTYLTKPTAEDTLKNFYRRIHPGGIGWKRIAAQIPEAIADTGYGGLFLDWLCGIVLVYSMLFGLGKLLLGDILQGCIYIVVGLVAAGVIYWDLSKRGFEKVVK